MGLRGFAPAAAGFHPEDRGGDTVSAPGGGLVEEKLGDPGGQYTEFLRNRKTFENWGGARRTARDTMEGT